MLFTAVWVAPALCFFTFIFLNFVNSGYLLMLSAPACLWLGFWASEWYENTAGVGPSTAEIGVCAAANVLIFLESPLYCSYRSVRRFEAQLEGIRKALPQVGPRTIPWSSASIRIFSAIAMPATTCPATSPSNIPKLSCEKAQGSSLCTNGKPACSRIAGWRLLEVRSLSPPGGDLYREYGKSDQAAPQPEPEQAPPRLRLCQVVHAGMARTLSSGQPPIYPFSFRQSLRAPKQGVYAPLHSGMRL